MKGAWNMEDALSLHMLIIIQKKPGEVCTETKF